jgi:hypothetical protein
MPTYSTTSKDPNAEYDTTNAKRAPDDNAMARRMQQLQQPAAPSPWDTMRQKAQAQASTANNEAQDALARRFASMGNLNSGAYIKQAGIQDQKSQEGLSQSLNDIGAQEGQLKQQQEFQSGEAQKQRDFQKSIVDQSQEFQNKVFNFDSKTKLRQLDMADKEFDRDSLLSSINAATAFGNTDDKDAFQRGIKQFMALLQAKQGSGSTFNPMGLSPESGAVPGTRPGTNQVLPNTYSSTANGSPSLSGIPRAKPGFA